ncbi:MAG: helix-turn-helix domain-containing protein [Ruminococcaceae bacterium]|nr:helix-turn-helix domain-containing protein [Oscillospiraceae bacterium]
MDTYTIGSTIAKLRKKSGMTQLSLAEQLNVSDKAVSKWENGQGYPDITLFPTIASLFGVSIDYLMTGEKKSITIAGNMLVDIVKNIDDYPKVGTLANIHEIDKAVGGCAANTPIDLAIIDHSVPIHVLGKVGMDENGRYIISKLQSHGINTDGISYSTSMGTSFSDVMSMPTGERTFFHQRGANAEFAPSDINLDRLDCEILHIGYILLLDKFDAPDKVYGTVMARFLHDAQSRGIRTSIDVVSANTDDYDQKIIPALRYCNFAIMNEIEATATWKLPARRANGKIHRENVRLAMQKMAVAGVKDKIIVHAKEMSFILDVATGEFDEVPSLKIPAKEIMGSVGAGDAFCAGCLYGLYNNYADKQILEFASAAAACNLFAANSVDGMRSRNEILQLTGKYGRLNLEEL